MSYNLLSQDKVCLENKRENAAKSMKSRLSGNRPLFLVAVCNESGRNGLSYGPERYNVALLRYSWKMKNRSKPCKMGVREF